MAIGRLLGELTEALTTGAFAAAIVEAFNALKGEAAKKAGKVVLEHLGKVITEKGLDDSRGFADSLARANIDQSAKHRIEKVLAELEIESPKYASNFRRTVAIGPCDYATKRVERPDGTVESCNDPDWKHPGVAILETLAPYDEAHLKIAMLAYGLMDDAPDGPLDQVWLWLRTTALPEFGIKFDKQFHVLGDAIYSGVIHVNRQYAKRRLRKKARKKMTWAKWLHPKNLWQMYLDQF